MHRLLSRHLYLQNVSDALAETRPPTKTVLDEWAKGNDYPKLAKPGRYEIIREHKPVRV